MEEIVVESGFKLTTDLDQVKSWLLSICIKILISQ